MYPTSEALNKLVSRSHVITSQVDVHDPSGEKIFGPLKVESGFVRVDGSNAVRRRFTGNLIDYTGNLTPSDVSDIFHPLARNEFRVYRGVVFPDGSYELVPQGVFDMSDVNIGDSRDNFSMEVQGYDRSRDVQRRRFVKNYRIGAGTNYAEAIMEMISDQRPETIFEFDDVSYVTPSLIFGGNEETGGGNAWDSGRDMAESIGMQIYFDLNGVCKLTPLPGFAGTPDWTYYEGESGLLHVERRLSDEETRNHIVVFGQSTSNEEQIRGEATDDDPDSPTFIGGPFGDIPGFERSEFVRTEAQANELAQAILQQKLGIEETIQVTTTVHPGHEVGDLIGIRRSRSGIDANYVLDDFTMPLEASQSLSLGVRRKR